MQAQALYDPANEHDACGVGLVANVNNVASHQIVLQGITVLKRLMHRGAAGGDPETGDGAGLLLSMPHRFFRKAVPELPARYGVAMYFVDNSLAADAFDAEIARIAKSEGVETVRFREVPVDPSAIGRTARATLPHVRQAFFDGTALNGNAAFDVKLYVIRRLAEKTCEGLYFCSCSRRSVVYKGLLLASQIEGFYKDLDDPDFESPLALVHQRYSTNTFPTWQLAHPFRYLAHNGEINTLRGNLNSLKAREPHLKSDVIGDDLKKLLPLIPAGQSDSACLDNMFELLVAAGRSLPHAMMMLMPQAWGAKHYLGRDVRGFFEYESMLMEPWDGPAAVAFSDGVNAGAILDRNGLRPARYTLCKDGLFVMASETGVLDIRDDEVEEKGRLKPGEIIYLDLENRRILRNAEMKAQVARSKPYRRWVAENKMSVRGLFDEITPSDVPDDLLARQKRFGYSAEDLTVVLKPMAEKGAEPIGSMGNDAALAVLSDKPQPLFGYFKQLFAQVTNPPIDPIREELVMSLTTYIGNHGNILEETPEQAHLIKIPRPIVTEEEIRRFENIGDKSFKAKVLKMQFPLGGDADVLEGALQNLAGDAVRAVSDGFDIIVLSDRDLDWGYAPVPSLLATACVNRALVEAGVRPEIGLIVQSGEVREVMHFALLLGYGATVVNPYLAFESISGMCRSGELDEDPVTAAANYVKAVDKGLLKIMSKMGISTLRSYRGAQIFEAVGLGRELVDRFLPGTASRIGGIGLAEIAREANERQRLAFSDTGRALVSAGQYSWRKEGEKHLWTPQSLAAFRQAVQGNDYSKFKVYSKLVDDQSERQATLRGLFKFKKTEPVDISEVESRESIVKRFVSGAMSLGSLSPEAHEAIAIAMNRVGAMSNCGEGGEDPDRNTPAPNGDVRSSAIRQVASGRFGVTIDYLRRAKDLQIKMAQGAKPGEGGQLPAHKVNAFVARIRHSIPNVSLISPPPHHDIYSIEDLAQLIYDLRNANPKARVSVKLVSEVGVGTVAAGVAKAHADVVLISGHDGGTGASPLTSIKHAGLPWELGIAEAEQTLVLNDLRGRVKLQVDGQLKTGRDVVVAALLGAEEFGFATNLLVSLGCVMDRKCHSNTCPMGIATQDAELRRRFAGKPEYVENFLFFVADEVREILAGLGLRSLDEACGRSDLLEKDEAIGFYKAKNLDFSKIFETVESGTKAHDPSFKKEPLENFDRREILPFVKETLAKGSSVELSAVVRNTDRTVGAELSGEIDERFGAKGLPEDTAKIHLQGVAGQSFGAFLAPGVTLDLEGEANDFMGKGLSGGKIVVRPPRNASFKAEENVIAGNVVGYGGTSGKIFVNGLAGERFGIRNSGMLLVSEGVGDHGCEYMTGGRAVVLGRVGVNFAAGMTGGFAYVYDETGHFDLSCNVDSVDLESVLPGTESERELIDIIEQHVRETGSEKGRRILDDWNGERPKFVKVFPVDYRRALQAAAEAAP
ncbi:MAG: glutamate synthase large subunit [Fibrobacterales bacterium]|nr:glutamate synthase large subunit [Fibrobacterales bacterium]